MNTLKNYLDDKIHLPINETKRRMVTRAFPFNGDINKAKSKIPKLYCLLTIK